MGPPGSVGPPSTSSHQESDQASGLQEHKTHSNSFVLVKEGVVSGLVAGVDGATPTPFVVIEAPEATTQPQVPPRSPQASADCPTILKIQKLL